MVRRGSTLNAEWPPKDEKKERRKRYGKGWDDGVGLRRRHGQKKEDQHAETKTPREAAKEKNPQPDENFSQSAPETGGEKCGVSDHRPDDNAELEVGTRGEPTAAGAPGPSERIPDGEEAEQRAEDEEVPGDGRPTERQQQQQQQQQVEQDDPFADEDDDKENREPPALVPPVEESSEDESPAGEEWGGFDESNTGLGVDLMEEVWDF